MNLAVFSDLHGRILLAFALCARWERETGEHIDLLLQAGDLAAFPDPRRLDRATHRHAKVDPEELGFSADFTVARPDVEAILGMTACPMIFVRGNHEDHGFLDERERAATEPIFPVDAYGRIHCLKTGVPYAFEAGPQTIRLLGIGRVGAPPLAGPKPKYIQPDEQARLRALRETRSAPPGSLDILLTHDVPLNLSVGQGMAEIRVTLDAHEPRYHFYGHTEEPYKEELDRNGVTTAIRLADLDWGWGARHGMLSEGSMGILRWRGPEDSGFEVVDAPWLTEYTAWDWRAAAEALARG